MKDYQQPTQPLDLNGLAGRHVEYRGTRYMILEVLPEGPAVVLQSLSEDSRALQDDQYGNPSRRVPYTLTVALLDASGSGLNPALTWLSGAR